MASSSPSDSNPNSQPGDPDPNPNLSPQEELDFSILFDYDYTNPIAASAVVCPVLKATLLFPEETTPSHKIISPPSGVTYPHDDVSDYGLKPYPFALSSLSADHMGRYGQPDSIGSKCYLDPVKAAGLELGPRIEITPFYELTHSGGSFSSRDTDLLVEHQSSSATASPRFTLPVPGFESYREPLCLSPPSSGSSASFISETNFSPYTSPCVSPNNGPSDDLCPQFQNTHAHYSPRTSPIMSPQATIVEDTCLGPRSPSSRPNSRSSSPGAKRRYPCTDHYGSQQPSTSPRQSRTPSPLASPQVPLREDGSSVTYTQLSTSSSLMDAMSNLTTDPSCGVPTKIGRASPDSFLMSSHKASLPCHVLQPVEYIGSCEQDDRRNAPPESILLVPPSWPKQLMPAIPICSIPVQSLPPLEWPLPSHSGSYELRIEVQPKPHHRAHYETEGSRGAVKAPTGGHPVVQVGTITQFREDVVLTSFAFWSTPCQILPVVVFNICKKGRPGML
ncbi:Nuclear factor of activated T-cells, cytoplasmic 2 [Varanus komodoensis]|nr:Nuclear factor of activated T-cells, cytoplasmic 2 [Varanus komodoensis]